MDKVRKIVLGIIDFFHRPFARWIPTQLFRYLACGGSNTVLNLLIYWLSYDYVLHKQNFNVTKTFIINPEQGAYVIAFCISFPIGFILSRHIVFPESNLHGRIQFFRYGITTVTFIIITSLLIQFFKIYIPIIPAKPAYFIICIIVALMSYVLQRIYTFKTTNTEKQKIYD